MEYGGSKITRVKLYKCGYCKNNLGLVFKHYPRETRNFPALAVLIQHRELGNILYDTGYSKLIYKNHVVSFLYNLLNRTYVEDADVIVSKLEKDKITPQSIKRIILSHAHPDHMAGLKLFPSYELLSTEKVLQTMKGANPFRLVFANMVPTPEQAQCREVQSFAGTTFLKKYFDKVYDVLDDGSILGVELNGHGEGQLGIYLPEYKLLFAADACWGSDLLGKVKDMRLVAKLIQNDYKSYLQTANKLEQLQKDHPDIKIIYSHDGFEETTYEQ